MRQRKKTGSSPRSRLAAAGRYAAVAAAVLLLLLVSVYVAARQYLPDLVARKADIEAQLSAAAQHPVRLGEIALQWDGLNPGVRVSGVAVYDKQGERPSVRVDEVRVSVAPLPLLWGRLEVQRLVLVRPVLAAARLADGSIRIEGLDLPAGSTPGAGLAWLLAQPRVSVRDGEVTWTDARDPAGAVRLSGIDARLRNAGEHHRLRLALRLPDGACGECALSADVTGVPGAGPWDGEISVRVQGLTLQALPLVLRELMPAAARGRVDADLWSDWRGGVPIVVRGVIDANGLVLPWSAAHPPLEARRLAGDVSWQHVNGGWRLDLSHLSVGLTRAPWPAGRLHLYHTADESRLELEHLDLGDLTAFVAQHQAGHPWLARWSEIGPTGIVDKLKVTLHGPLDAPRAYAVEGELLRVSTARHARLPSATGLSGRLRATSEEGELKLDARGFAFALPTVFRAPLLAERVGGLLTWRKGSSAWHVIGTDLYVHGLDGKGGGTMNLEIPFDRTRSPVLELRVDFRDGNGARAARYYPAYKLPPRVLAWIESSFVGGHVTSGYLLYSGPIRAFPFDHGEGRFELRARVRDGIYRYLPGWEVLTGVEAEVAIDGADALITGRGRIGALQAHDVRVEVKRAPGESRRSVTVTGRVDGPVAETVRVLRGVEAENAFWRAPLQHVGAAAGSGALDLEVHVVPGADPGTSFVASYRFKDAALKAANGTGLEAANGMVRFGENGLHHAEVRGRLFGGPLAVAAATEGGMLRVQASGRAQLAELLRGRGPVAARLTGATDWTLAWERDAHGVRARLESDLRDLRSRLPPPFDKSPGEGVPRLVVGLQAGDADTATIALDAAPALSGNLAFRRAAHGWRFDRGRIDIGRTAGAMPAQPGLALGITAQALDIDQWLPLFSGSAPRGTKPAVSVTTVSADIRRLGLLNRDWGHALIHLVRYRDGWRAVLDGDAVAGEASAALGSGASRVRLDLAYLRLPPRRQVEQAGERPADPRALPSVGVRARAFEYEGRRLGELSFDAAPHVQGWRIERLEIARPETVLSANGLWRRSGTRETSEFDVTLKSEDLGAALDAWGAEGQMAGGSADVRGHLSWTGPPTSPALASLAGKVEVKAEKGRFLRFDPGAARLFGLLDLRSISRYLTLDFSSAFGKGYAFDAIYGEIAIERGNASTRGLVVSGPALNLNVAGRVGLVAEDYDLVLDASPRVGDTLTLTTWGLFGPQAAAAVLALRKLFKRQLQESTRVTYVIKGPWDKPEVSKLAKPEPEPAPSPQPP